MKTFLTIGIALIGLALAGTGGLYGAAHVLTDARLAAEWTVPTPQIELSTDPLIIERGRQLTQNLLLCAGCHDDDLGGQSPHMDVPGLLVLNTPNLTSGEGGVVDGYSPSDLARVIRYGVRPDGTAVMAMPVQSFTGMSDDDLGAVVSYIHTLEPVERVNSKSEMYAIGRVLWAVGVFDLQFSSLIEDVNAPRPIHTPTSPSEHGAYLFRLGGCMDCHGETASGGAHPMAPPELAIPRNLTPHATGLKGWTRDDFDRAVRGGVSKNGDTLDTLMPSRRYAGLSPTEIDALWVHVQTLEPKEFGGR